MSRYNDRAPEHAEYSVTASPSYQLLTAAELRVHLRLPDFGDANADENAYLESLIAAAGNSIEATVRRPIRAQTRELVIGGLPHAGGYKSAWWASGAFWWGYSNDDNIILDITPIRAVNTIQYVTDGVVTTIPPADYRVVGTGEHITRRVEIILAEGASWPCPDYETDVTISADCGFTQANLPEDLKHAARIIAGSFYRFREDVVTGTIVAELPRSAKYLLQQYQRFI